MEWLPKLFSTRKLFELAKERNMPAVFPCLGLWKGYTTLKPARTACSSWECRPTIRV